jgi:hypothetical protein
MLLPMPRLTTRTWTPAAEWAGIAEMSRRVLLVAVKQPGAAAAHSRSATGVPAANSAVVPISIAVAPPRLVPVTASAPPPPDAPLVGLMPVTTGADGTAPAGALDAVAGAASADPASADVPPVINADVTLLDVTTPLTVMLPLVKGLDVDVHEICCPDGAAQVQPVPDATKGTTPVGRVWVMVTGWFSVAPLAVAVTV